MKVPYKDGTTSYTLFTQSVVSDTTNFILNYQDAEQFGGAVSSKSSALEYMRYVTIGYVDLTSKAVQDFINED